MNKEHQEFLKEYQEEMNKIVLPAKIREKYEIIKCLKDGEDTGTFLAQNGQSGSFCVIKRARGRFRKLLRQEYEVLVELTEKKFAGIPIPYGIEDDGEEVFFLREYVNGRSLYEYAEESGGLSWRRIAEIGGEICKIVEQFQKLENPLVHRDIKPENLILTDGGELVLVDFGTMRTYRAQGNRDTFLIGSDGTAAPEQYGFRQTDRRTDVYAIGRTLWFLAAGCYQEDALKEARISRWLRHIIDKSASFDPGKRYQSAEELRKALERCRRTAYYQTAAAGAVLICALAGGTGYYLHMEKIGPQEEGRAAEAKITEDPIQESEPAQKLTKTELTDKEEGSLDNGTADILAEDRNRPGDSEEKNISEGYLFKEPLIEQAVRQQLGLGEEEVITGSMLEEITDLKIVGNEIYEPETDILYLTLNFSAGEEAIGNIEQGEISDLSDLAHMKHLLHVALGKQCITDLSPLEGLPICDLNLAENQIEDFSVLGKLPYLKKLNIGNNPGENLQGLETCTSLEELHIDGMNLENVDFMENLPVMLMTMWATGIKSGNLEPLGKIKNLRGLEIWLTEGEIRPEVFSKINTLGLLSIGAYPYKDLTAFEECPEITSLDIIDGLESAEGLEHFPNITSLNLRSEKLHDMSPIRYARKLEELSINSQIIFDYTPLLEHPNLKKVYCTQQQKKEILDIDPEPDFEIIIL